MKTNKKIKKEIDVNEVALTVYVDNEVIGKVRSGEINQIRLDVNDDNYRLILENIDGHLLLVVDEMPETFHGCYLYNKGVFPYAIKNTLDFLLLKGEEYYCLTRIIGINTEPGVRFRFQGQGKPSVEDPNGDSCIWEAQFEIIPIPSESRHYLMRWNPAISSFTEKDYEACVANMEHGMFRINWSICDWEEARRGDFFYMMRVGDDKAGIVFSGQFLTDPYPGDDWGGSTKRRMYVDMVCMNPAEPQAGSNISLEKLQKAIPSFEWSRGHSGVLLPNNVTEELEKLM
jgi:hypothetical protein